MVYKYFTQWDFDRCTPACSIEDIDYTLLNLLDRIRFHFGKPIVVNSAYREPEYEHLKGRDGSSAHCYGVAVDISCTNSHDRIALISLALNHGFNRIGIGKTFIHLDIADWFMPDEYKPAIWLYD